MEDDGNNDGSCEATERSEKTGAALSVIVRSGRERKKERKKMKM
jgi:hypothetical protein